MEFNFEPLTPTAFLDRSATVYPHRTAVIDGDIRRDYAEFHDRCLREAGALAAFGVAPGDRVAVLSPNAGLLLESHFGVLYAGAVLVALNTRLSAGELRYIVQHSGSRVLLHHPSLSALAAEITEPLTDVRRIDGGGEYEALLAGADPLRVRVADERGLMALDYTSGTTGRPKGVMYHHRGAYLQALAMVAQFGLRSDSVYLWTLPMFHCNGWCFPWAVTAACGTHVCMPHVNAGEAWRLIDSEGVTHLCAAPTVLIDLSQAGSARRPQADHAAHPVAVAVGGAPPTPTLLQRCAAVGLDVTHLYGLTETYGPATICDWHPEWNGLSPAEQAERKARQGVPNLISCPMRVIGPDGSDVPADGQSLGELAMRGNNLMLGYYRDAAATEAATPEGWFRTGDLGVMHPDGYVEVRDRAKDIIISGGENISSIEVESALSSHPDVLECAVVAMPDEHWGERPVAWVALKPGATATAEELRGHVSARIAHFKAPDQIFFGPLPKTGSGKIRKVELRSAARDLASPGGAGGTS